ncbi:unnamed protein product [Laminaria digitata]
MIASEGYLYVPECIEDKALRALRAEADSLFNLKRSKCALSEDEYFDKGCALDFFTNSELQENDEARLSMDKYMSRRNGPRRPRGAPTLSAFGAREKACTAPPSHASRDDKKNKPEENKQEENWTDKTPPDRPEEKNWTVGHISVVRETVFETLAGLARHALKAQRSPRQLDSPNLDQPRQPSSGATAGGGGPLLFNEQYVVKPPRSSIEFGWHTDEQEQLAMCVFPPGVHPPLYVSVWLALDDCDAVNGCLEVYPQAWNRPRLQAPTDEDDALVVCIPAKAGDAVVFLSNLWHRSGPNQTEHARRVFYAQYSVDVIRATPSDPRPLSLAVPCPLSGTVYAERRGEFSRPESPSFESSAESGAAEAVTPPAAAPAVGAEKILDTIERNPADSVGSTTLGLVRRRAEAEQDCSSVSCRGSSKRGR